MEFLFLGTSSGVPTKNKKHSGTGFRALKWDDA